MIVRAELAARLYAQRRARDQVFRDYADGFGEPAWDLILSLYMCRGEMPLGELCRRSSVRPAVAERYVRWMASRELVRVDGGAAVLTMEGRRLIDAYLDRVWGADDEGQGISLI